VTASTDRASPLASWSAAFAKAGATPAAFAIRELPFTTQVNLRGNASDAAFAAAVRGAIGCELPREANTHAVGPDIAAIWLGPDEWLVVAQAGRADAISASLRQALAGKRHSVSDVSASRTVIEISGSDARLVLAKGCPLDMHSSSFAPPRTAQTLLAKANVIIQCMDAAPRYRLFVRSSFASYVAEWLTDAARECAAARVAGFADLAARLAPGATSTTPGRTT
jgi:sarcosine oxidase subunit gamma